MKKYTFLLLLWASSLGSVAETLDLSVFTVNVPDDWMTSIDEGSASSIDWSDTATIHPASGIGELKMRALTSPSEVNELVLHGMTNLDESIQLDWQTWTNFSGYEYSYTENSKFYKQWWIVNNQTVLFATYVSDEEPGVATSETIETVISSIEFH